MRAIRALMASENFAGIPAQFRSMKRIWPNVKGLQSRREREAQLFEAGLRARERWPDQQDMPPPPDIPAPKPVDPEVINKTDDAPDEKPAVKSKTIWASILGIVSSVAAFVTDWKILTVLVVAFFAFVILDRYMKLDIKGWFRS